jgi:hypothetical protein
MTNQDLSFIIFYGISSIIGIILSIYHIYKADTHDKVLNGLLGIIVSITPGVLLISIIIILAGIMYIFIFLPTKLISKIKNIKD